MKYEIKDFFEEGLVRITVADERWYVKEVNKQHIAVPSVTWIAGKYPKGVQFYKWLAQKGWDEAEAIKAAAGDKGSKVHNAIEDLLKGKEVKMDSKYTNQQGEPEELSLEEYECLLAFKDFYDDIVEKASNVKTLKTEFVTFSEKHNYAGTIDWLVEIGDEVYLIDFKTSQSIWTEYELQLSAYKQSLEESGQKVDKVAILQVGYRLNKRGWKLTEIEDKFPLFLHAKAIWEEEHGNEKPKVKDYPQIIKL